MKVRVNQKTDFHFIGSGEDLDLELPIDAAAHVGWERQGIQATSPSYVLYRGVHGNPYLCTALHKAGKRRGRC